MISLGLSAIACCLWFVVGLAFGFHIGREPHTMNHTGIELRIRVNGDVTLQADSDFLHYCAKYADGVSPGDWMHAAAWPTCYGTIRVEIRALELADLDGELAELGAELELGDQAAAAAAELAGNAAAPVPEVDTGAAILTELPTQDAPARPPGRHRPRDLGIAIARIARRARFLSAR